MHKRVWPTTFALKQSTFSGTGLFREAILHYGSVSSKHACSSAIFQTVQFKNGSAAGGPRFFVLSQSVQLYFA